MRTERGFTLLEVLVALVVLGALLLALAQGTQFGLLAWHTQSRMIAEQSDIDIVARTLDTLVGGLDPGGPSRGATVEGHAHSVSFIAPLPLAATRLQTREADITLLVDGDRRLSLLWVPHVRNWLGPPRTPQRSTLLDGVRDLEISYWQPARDGSGAGKWLDAWKDAGAPPIIRFRILPLAGPTRRPWPDIMVAPMRDRFRP